MLTAEQITQQANSNLAIAIAILPREKRENMVIFYAFCRVIDDLADDLSVPAETRRAQLLAWQNGLQSNFANPSTLQKQICALRDRENLPNELLLAIIDGCIDDLDPSRRYQTFDELSGYTWKVASAVGILSAQLFGCQREKTTAYATALGHALQLTNILRDIGEDFSRDQRLYVPMELFHQHSYSVSDLAAHVQDHRFTAIARTLAQRAESYFQQARELFPESEAHHLTAAVAMGEIYYQLLQKIRAGRYQVLRRRFRVSKCEKIATLVKCLINRSSAL